MFALGARAAFFVTKFRWLSSRQPLWIYFSSFVHLAALIGEIVALALMIAYQLIAHPRDCIENDSISVSMILVASAAARTFPVFVEMCLGEGWSCYASSIADVAAFRPRDVAFAALSPRTFRRIRRQCGVTRASICASLARLAYGGGGLKGGNSS
eukprot:2271271-Pleurochrysis_carterae.AAC.2